MIYNPNLIIIANQVLPVEGVTGGEKLLVELINRWQNVIPLRVILPSNGMPIVDKNVSDHLCIHMPLLFGHHPKSHFGILFRWGELAFRTSILLAAKQKYEGVVYTSADFYCNTFPAAIARLRHKNIKWVGVVHHIIEPPGKRVSRNSWLTDAGAFIMQQFSLLLLRNYADCVFLLNQTVKRQLENMGFDRSKLYVTGSGIDTRQITLAIADMARRYDACFVGRLDPTKGVRELISTWAIVIKQIPNAKLALIGRTNQEETCLIKELVEKLNLQYAVSFLGFLSEQEKYAVMKASKIFVSLSFEEGWGMAVTEALACGLPVVAWNLPIYHELYGGDIIKAVPVGNIADAANQIVELLHDEAQCKEMAAKGVAVGMQYDFDLVAGKQLDVIKKSVGTEVKFV